MQCRVPWMTLYSLLLYWPISWYLHKRQRDQLAMTFPNNDLSLQPYKRAHILVARQMAKIDLLICWTYNVISYTVHCPSSQGHSPADSRRCRCTEACHDISQRPGTGDRGPWTCYRTPGWCTGGSYSSWEGVGQAGWGADITALIQFIDQLLIGVYYPKESVWPWMPR